MEKAEIGMQLFFLGSIAAIVFLGALWSVELAYRTLVFVV